MAEEGVKVRSAWLVHLGRTEAAEGKPCRDCLGRDRGDLESLGLWVLESWSLGVFWGFWVAGYVG
jgi:hypothetical protein